MATEKEVRWDNQSVLGNLKEINSKFNTIAEGIEFLKTNTNSNTIATAVKTEGNTINNEDEVIPIETIVQDDEMITDVEEIISKPKYTKVERDISTAYMENGMARSLSFSSEQIKNLSSTRGMVK